MKWPWNRKGSRRNPGKILPDLDDILAHQAELARLHEHPPHCGNQVVYRQGAETFGEFVFPAALIENHLMEEVRRLPHLAASQRGSILKWVQSREESDATPTAVPSLWPEFKFVANALARAGYGTTGCAQCQAQIPGTLLIRRDDDPRLGGTFERLFCPAGHLLLAVEKAHLAA